MSISKQDSSSPGYSLELTLKQEELGYIKEEISKQWLNRLLIQDKNLISYISSKNISIEEYHHISNRIEHSKIWSKNSRILWPSFNKCLEDTDFYKKLKTNFGDFIVSDEENLGWPNFYWRITRPKESQDIGPVHRDSWFWKLNDQFIKPKYPFFRVKVWIAIYSEPGKNGLLVEPDSHKRKDIIWDSNLRDGIAKPLLDQDKNILNMKLINSKPGQVIIFNDDLLHGGSPNNGNNCRVSLEFTMLIRND